MQRLVWTYWSVFLAFKDDLEQYHSENFYFNINTHHNRMVTGPYHAMASLYGVIKNHALIQGACT